MLRIKCVSCLLFALVIVAPAYSVVTDNAEVNVLGALGLAQASENSCMAVWIPAQPDVAISGIKWYNNDGTVAFPEILVQGGTADYPVALANAVQVAVDVNGLSSGWSEVEFSSLVGSASGGLYVIFKVPDGVATTADGAGGGPAIGYTTAASGYAGWMSPDGLEWLPVHANYGFAVQPILVAGSPGITLKSARRSGVGNPVMGGLQTEAVKVTALLPASPNPFNPQTTLKFSLREAGQVDLGVFNLRGELVQQLVSEHKDAGEYTTVWDGRDRSGHTVASGVYFARFIASEVRMTQRLVLVQ